MVKTMSFEDSSNEFHVHFTIQKHDQWILRLGGHSIKNIDVSRTFTLILPETCVPEECFEQFGKIKLK